MSRKHSAVDRLVQKVQEASQPASSIHESSRLQADSEPRPKQPSMRFNIQAGSSIYTGLMFLIVGLILPLGILAIRVVSHQSNDRTMLLLALSLLTFFPGSMYFLLQGLSAKRSQLLLGQEKMAIDPLFWEKRIVIEYRQLINANWHYVGRGLQRREQGITINYYPLTLDNRIDTSQVRTHIIKGAENEKQLLFELQERASAPKHLPDITYTQAEKRVLLKRLQDKPVDKPTKKTRDYWVFFLIFILVGGQLLGLFLSARSIWLRAQLPKYGVNTTGTVIEHQIYHRKGPEYYFITSEYHAVDSSGETRLVTQEHSGTEEQYQLYPPGSSIPLIYFPQHPRTSDIAGNETELLNDKWDHENFRRSLISMGGPLLIVIVIQLTRGYFLSRKKSVSFRSFFQ